MAQREEYKDAKGLEVSVESRPTYDGTGNTGRSVTIDGTTGTGWSQKEARDKAEAGQRRGWFWWRATAMPSGPGPTYPPEPPPPPPRPGQPGQPLPPTPPPKPPGASQR